MMEAIDNAEFRQVVLVICKKKHHKLSNGLLNRELSMLTSVEIGGERMQPVLIEHVEIA